MNYGGCGFAFHLMADGVKKVRFAKAGMAVNKKGIICIAGRLADGDAACVCQPIAGADDEIVERIIGMEHRFVSAVLARRLRLSVPVGRKLNGYEMAGDLLGGLSKGALAVIPEELGARLIRAADFERPAGQSDEAEIVKPFSGVDGVKGLRTVQYIHKDIIDFTRCQAMLLYKSRALKHTERLSPPQITSLSFEWRNNTTLCSFIMMTIPD